MFSFRFAVFSFGALAVNSFSRHHFTSRRNALSIKSTACSAIQENGVTSRRSAVIASVFGLLSPFLEPEESIALADDESDMIEVYFGCGCFWHVQHEFVEAERKILGRSDSELTSRAGYAGGKAGSKDGKVCYHNAANVSDYGSLGHGEVVRLEIPSNDFPEFAKEYFKLFNEKGERADQFGDVGLEYRNLIGIPGGAKGDLAKKLVEVSSKNGDKLDFSKGRGSDPDARALAFVYDTAEYPFFIGEQYHQFHDGFNLGENYPKGYNNLANQLAAEDKLGSSSCPNGLLGVGILGL